MKDTHASRQKKATHIIGGFYVITAELWVDTQSSKIERVSPGYRSKLF